MAAALVALGSNLGAREALLGSALRAIARECGRVQAVSHLYETQPAYVEDQPAFLNAACLVETDLDPHRLLERLRGIETAHGRDRSADAVRFGPRSLDLDVITYEDRVIDTPDLTVPHPRACERDFVLYPLLDIAPDFVAGGRTFAEHWADLGAPALDRVFATGAEGELWKLAHGRSYVMGIINASPDSFSGDGVAATAAAVEQGLEMLANGAHCLDIGGLSTRPGHDPVGPDVEIERIVPVVEGLRAAGVRAPISVDTSLSVVAKAALGAGANMINDVHALKKDPGLADLGAPLILMDNRVLPQRDVDAHPDGDSYAAATSAQDIVGEIAADLRQQVGLARSAGIPPWSLMVDPGIGFGKTTEDNLAIIAGMDRFKALCGDLPTLLGVSRKSFIGRVLEEPVPAQRVEGTAAACVIGAARGVNVFRVHDVAAVGKALRMADAVLGGWRPME